MSKRAFAPSRSTSITPKSGTSREQVLEFQYPPDAEERGHVPLQHLVYDVVAQELLSLRNALQQRAGTPVQTMKPNFLLPGVVLSLAGLSLVASAADISGKVMTRGMQPLALATVTACWGSSKERITSTNQTVTDADGEYTLSIEAEGVFVELTYAEKRHRPAFWRTNLPPAGAVHSEELIPTPRTFSATDTDDEVKEYWMLVAAQTSGAGEITALWQDLDRRSADSLDKAYLAHGLKSRTVGFEGLGRTGKEIQFYSTTDVDKLRELNRRIANFMDTRRTIPTAPLCAAWTGPDPIPKLVMAESIGDQIAAADPGSRAKLYGDFTKEWGDLRLENNLTGSKQLDGLISERVGALDAFKLGPK